MVLYGIEKCQNNIRLTALLPTQRNFCEKIASDSEGIMPTRSTFEEINLKRPASAIRQVRVRGGGGSIISADVFHGWALLAFSCYKQSMGYQ